eukprot:COSAG02_NODE_4212_length_5624_cov_12.618281_5_plen_37_part_00
MPPVTLGIHEAECSGIRMPYSVIKMGILVLGRRGHT